MDNNSLYVLNDLFEKNFKKNSSKISIELGNFRDYITLKWLKIQIFYLPHILLKKNILVLFFKRLISNKHVRYLKNRKI